MSNDISPKSVYFLTKSFDACFTYRVLYPSKYLERSYGWKCYYDLIDSLFELEPNGMFAYDRIKPGRLDLLKSVDLVVLQRGTDDGHLQLLRFIRDKLKKPIIYEADDSYVDVPPQNSGYKYFAPRKHIIEQIISECDCMTVSVSNLAKVYGKYNPKIEVLKNCIDFERLDSSEAMTNDDRRVAPGVYRVPSRFIEPFFDDQVRDQCIQLLKNARREVTENAIEKMIKSPMYFHVRAPFEMYAEIRDSDKDVIIGWGGSPTHVKDIAIVREPLAKVMDKYRKVHLSMIGFVYMMAVLKDSLDSVDLKKWLPTIDPQRFWLFDLVGVKAYYNMCKALSWDISLAPVIPDEFNRSKSGLKVLEAMSFGAYPIASDFETYHGVMCSEKEGDQDLGRGRLCRTPEEWERAFYDVLNDAAMRKESVDWNWKFVRKNYSSEAEAWRWDKFYRSVL